MPTTYAIPNGRTVMDATTYTGDGTNGRTITNQYGFLPDLTWIKSRSNAFNNNIYDSNRGAPKEISSNLTSAESNGDLIAFASNGFTVNQTASYEINHSGYTYVAWQWNAGSNTTSSNTAGSITSTVSVNATAGFSIVTWTGTGSGNTTVGHGLGAVPKLYITKNRSSSADWGVFFPDTFTGTPSQNKFMYLNTLDTAGNASQSLPTSTVLSLNGGFENASGNNYVAYCWTPIAGFSQFGTYTGNGSTDGPFIYLGFRPKYVMIKRTDSSAGQWDIADTSRNPYNYVTQWLYAQASSAEDNAGELYDYLSNGFKLRNNGSGTNANGGSYLYMAWAENPFKYATAR